MKNRRYYWELSYDHKNYKRLYHKRIVCYTDKEVEKYTNSYVKYELIG